MATFTFDGSASQTIDFDPAADVLNFNVPANQILNVQDSETGVTVTLVSGAALVLTGVSYADLSAEPDSIVLQGGGDFIFAASGSTTTGTPASDVIVGTTAGDNIAAGNGNNLVFGGGSNNAPDDASDVITAGTGNDTIYGNGGSDLITSIGGSDSIIGGAGSDVIRVSPLTGQTVTVFGGGTGLDPNDAADQITVNSAEAGLSGGSALVFGNGGNDTIVVNTNGNNTVYGGVGADQINVGSVGAVGSNLVYGGENTAAQGADIINVTSSGNNTVFGGTSNEDSVDGADVITVTGNGANQVFGNAGGDTLNIVGTGANTVYGGLGGDSININQTGGLTGTGANVVYGGEGTDTILVTGNGNNTIFGGTGGNDIEDAADNITVTGTGNNVVYGNGGSDNLNINGSGSSTVYGGTGTDTIIYNGGAVGTSTTASRAVIYGGEGSDNINLTGFAGNSTIFGGIGGVDADDLSDVIRGGNGSDVIFGNGGNDVIATGGGADSITGGAGRDTFIVNDGGGANAVGAAGNKVITDYSSTDDVIAINGGTAAGNYTAAASGNNVVLTAFATGADQTVASNAIRTITLNNAVNQVVTVGFDAGLTTDAAITAGLAGATDSLLVANLGSTATTIGGAAAAFDGNDRFFSGVAADTIDITGGGSDFVSGGAGNDTINASTFLTSGDTIDGGAGVDVLNFTGVGGTTALDNVTNVEVINLATPAPGALTFNTVDGLVASGQTLTFNGSALNDASALTFNGAAETNGAFSVTGGAAGDVLTGGAGADTLAGGAGQDNLTGGAGNDSLLGGAGSDTISGGDGNDVIVGGANSTAVGAVPAVQEVQSTVISGTDAAADGSVTATINGVAVTYNFLAGDTDDAIAAGLRDAINTSTDPLVADVVAAYDTGTNTLSVTYPSAQGDVANFTITDTDTDIAFTTPSQDTAGNVGSAGVDGFDRLTGGNGNDTFVFTNLADSGGTATTADFITDLNLGDGTLAGRADVIDTSSLPTSVLATASSGAAPLAVASIADAFVALGENQAGLFATGGQTYLIVDGGANSATFNGAEDLVVRVTGVTGTLDINDFI